MKLGESKGDGGVALLQAMKGPVCVSEGWMSESV